MSTLLDIDKKLVKEFNIVEDLSLDEKKSYLDEQISSTLHVLWRLRVDTMMSSTVDLTDASEDAKAQHAQKLRDYRNDIKLLSAALAQFTALKKEL